MKYQDKCQGGQISNALALKRGQGLPVPPASVVLLLQASLNLPPTILLPGVLLLSFLQLVLYNWIFLFWVFYAFNFGSACTLNHGWNCIEEAPNKEQHRAAAHSASNAVEEMTVA